MTAQSLCYIKRPGTNLWSATLQHCSSVAAAHTCCAVSAAHTCSTVAAAHNCSSVATAHSSIIVAAARSYSTVAAAHSYSTVAAAHTCSPIGTDTHDYDTGSVIYYILCTYNYYTVYIDIANETCWRRPQLGTRNF